MKPLRARLITLRAGRIALLLGGALVALFASRAALAATNLPQWYEQSLVGIEVGPTGAQFGGGKHAPDYAANFNDRDIVRRCVKAKAKYLVLWVRDGEFTFHDSKLVPKPPGQGERNVLREAVEEGRKLNLPMIAPFREWC